MNAITILLVALQAVCVVGLVNQHFAYKWIREEIHRKFYGTRRVTPWWVKPFWGRWITQNLDGE